MSEASREHPLVVYGAGLRRATDEDRDAQWIRVATAPPGLSAADKNHQVDLLALRLTEILTPGQVQRLIRALALALGPSRRVRDGMISS